MKVLIIEDEPSLNQAMFQYLSQQHYVCESVQNFREAREKTECYQYDCIILDIMLPDGNGLELLRQLKANQNTDGVIIISARDQLDDKLYGLETGADDYLTKPFHLSELGARVAAIIRRKSLQGNTHISFGDLTLDVQSKMVTAHNRELNLTRKEYELLLYFLVNKNRVLSKNAIAAHLWGDDADLEPNHDFIYTHVKNLRKKLSQYGISDYIHSIYGMGYKFSLE